MTLGGKSHADQLPLFGPIRTSGYVRFRAAVKESQTSNALIRSAPIYDGVDAPPTASMCQSAGVKHHLRRRPRQYTP